MTADPGLLADTPLLVTQLGNSPFGQGAATKERAMDKDRVESAAQQVKGSVREAIGKITDDTKTQAEGAVDKAAGKIRSIIGGLLALS